jgi:ATP-dependent exoDNAse (exonuclease V) beta subunit
MNNLIQEFEPSDLECNWRTLGNIVNFNNEFYETASEILYQHFKNECGDYEEYCNYIRSIYENLAQKVPIEARQGKGFIGMREFPKKGELSYDELVGQHLVEDIEKLLEKGYQLKDIAILLRKGADEDKIVNILSKTDYDFISEKSLKLYASPRVRIIINTKIVVK